MGYVVSFPALTLKHTSRNRQYAIERALLCSSKAPFIKIWIWPKGSHFLAPDFLLMKLLSLYSQVPSQGGERVLAK